MKIKKGEQGENEDYKNEIKRGKKCMAPRAVKSAAELVPPGVWLEKPLRPLELVAAVEQLCDD